jgi:transcriptional regulator with XRE-family HTH domain
MRLMEQTCSTMTAPRPWKELGDRIRAAREAAGISRRELSIQVGCSENNCYRWEGGLHRPDTDNLYRIAQACGVTVEELHGEAGAADHHLALDAFIRHHPRGQTVTDAERRQLLAMPWDRIPTSESYFYALEAIRSQQTPAEAVASAEETEKMLRRGLANGRKVLGDDTRESTRIRKR